MNEASARFVVHLSGFRVYRELRSCQTVEGSLQMEKAARAPPLLNFNLRVWIRVFVDGVSTGSDSDLVTPQRCES